MELSTVIYRCTLLPQSIRSNTTIYIEIEQTQPFTLKIPPDTFAVHVSLELPDQIKTNKQNPVEFQAKTVKYTLRQHKYNQTKLIYNQIPCWAMSVSFGLWISRQGTTKYTQI